MRALLLAAGLGTRLRPLTDSVPKCLVPIHGKPLLEYWLDLLFTGGVDQALINTHYLPDAVRKFVAQSRWRERVTLVHEDFLLGTGGTIIQNKEFFCHEPFLVAHADNLTCFDPEAFFERHLNRPVGTAMTMMTFETDMPQTCGIVEENDRGIVIGFHEKAKNPPGNHANAAVYIFEPAIIDFLGTLEKNTIDLSTEVIPSFIGRICTFRNTGYHRDIGSLESLRKAEAEFPHDR